MALLKKIWDFILAILALILELIKYFLGVKNKSTCACACPVPVKKPDPFLYSQFWLMKIGKPVTWDNPDIFVFDGSVLIDPQNLKASTPYTIMARIWNHSFDVPVPNLVVEFSYLSFGMGTQSHPIASTTTDLGVVGVGAPTFPSVIWTTPAALGHYCVQVLLKPPDDSNWWNNLGQRNMHVTQPQSPAIFTFAVGNYVSPRPRAVRFMMDSYSIPPLPTCDDSSSSVPRPRSVGNIAPPVPDGWTVVLTPNELQVPYGGELQVQAEITPPAAFTGSMPINITGWDLNGPIGGVTLIVEVP